jgi:hypothetical protein
MGNYFKTFLLSLLVIFGTFGLAERVQAAPLLVFKNQFGEQTNGTIVDGGNFIGSKMAANSISSNLTGASAYPLANSYALVSAKLLPTMLLTGFSSGAGTCAGTDTVLQCIQKISGNTQNRTVISNVLTGFTAGAGTLSSSDTILGGLQKLAGNVAAHQADSTASDVAGLVVDFNALLAKLQAAHLMQ